MRVVLTFQEKQILKKIESEGCEFLECAECPLLLICYLDDDERESARAVLDLSLEVPYYG